MGRDDLADRLEATMAEAAAALRQIAPARDWLDELCADGDVLKTNEAAIIAGCSDDTIQRRCKAAEAAGKPLGYLIAAGAVWLVSQKRLLDWIEEHEGLPARLAAETRARKNAELRSSPHLSLRSAVATAS